MTASRSTSSAPPRGPAAPRRGVLLLVVLSMLTLFMMLGVAYVIMASRARESSRAFSRAITQDRLSDHADDRYLDKALMLLLRGPDVGGQQPANLTNSVLTFVPMFESLLDDLYGSVETLESRTTQAVVDSGVVCAVEIQAPTPLQTGTVPISPIEFAGRIVTFLPEKGRITSHRILRAEVTSSGGFRLWISNHGGLFPRKLGGAAGGGQTTVDYDLPPADTRVLVNGRGHGGKAPAMNESWDGYDFDDGAATPFQTNPFLAHIEPDPAVPFSSVVNRFSMFDLPPITTNADLDGDGTNDYCDNDGDGVLDGQFFRPGFAPIPVDGGNVLQVDLSCLIVDLDGRLNMNAHGSLASELYPEQNQGWPSGGQGGGPSGGVSGSQWSQMPLGSGYGPAEIDPEIALNELAIAAGAVTADEDWLSVLCGAVPGFQYRNQSGKDKNPSLEPGYRTIPLGMSALEGRYGGRARNDTLDPDLGGTIQNFYQGFEALPGLEGVNDRLSTFNELQYTGTTRPIDLHGRVKLNATSSTVGAIKPAGVVPTVQFAQPDANQAAPTPLDDDLTDDPYEINLVSSIAGGRNADPRTGGEHYPPQGQAVMPDNRFSLRELERVLRPYDPDSIQLAPRLFTLLGSQAEAARLLVTTESWSVPSITGEAADLLFGPAGWYAKVDDAQRLYATTGPVVNTPTANTVPDGLVPVDLAAGLKLDLTPPLQTDIQRRAFFKDLYLTCVALLESPGNNPSATKAEQYAQWAANVVEFQDADSTMTQYEYDPEPLDGWDVDGDPATTNDPASTRATVWGGERPDVIITQTLAWTNSLTSTGELYIMLHRPLKSTLTVAGDPPIAAEPIDPALQGTKPDQIDLGLVTPAGDPVWRLRLGSGPGDKIVRFDPLPNPPQDPNELGSQNPPTEVKEFAPHQWLCVRPSGASPEGITVPASPDVESFLVDSGSLQVALGVTEVRLERLANPAADHEPDDTKPDYNPYIVVDAADIEVIDRNAVPPANPAPHQISTRSGWARSFEPEVAAAGGAPAMSAKWNGNPQWLVWPDRPLIGITELLSVPGFAPDSYKPLPSGDPNAKGLFQGYTPPLQNSYLPDPRLLEVVRVPSRFAGTRLSFADANNDSQARIDLEQTVGIYESLRTTNQIDLAREPGLVNLNTISSDAVWRAVVQGGFGAGGQPGSQQPNVPSRTTADLSTTPAETMSDLLAVEGGNAALPPYEDTATDIPDVADNPWHRLYTATRLSNTATNRSHVFGIWLTVRTVEKVGGVNGQADLDTVKYSRMFVIYDRSKPVAYEPGRDHNVADGILLKRVLP